MNLIGPSLSYPIPILLVERGEIRWPRNLRCTNVERQRRLRVRRAGRGCRCGSCRAREARCGFRSQLDDPLVDRPRTLCFECFRVEMARRQDSARAVQVRLPLEQRSRRCIFVAAARRSRQGGRWGYVDVSSNLKLQSAK